ncbi:hypothetical protein [Streptosporangium saharense]|uniref:hypothetical protein n=1 Tax=Streptosporangium saharense TaxID=1706840 RepID=UPI0036C4445A
MTTPEDPNQPDPRREQRDRWPEGEPEETPGRDPAPGEEPEPRSPDPRRPIPEEPEPWSPEPGVPGPGPGEPGPRTPWPEEPGTPGPGGPRPGSPGPGERPPGERPPWERPPGEPLSIPDEPVTPRHPDMPTAPEVPEPLQDDSTERFQHPEPGQYGGQHAGRPEGIPGTSPYGGQGTPYGQSPPSRGAHAAGREEPPGTSGQEPPVWDTPAQGVSGQGTPYGQEPSGQGTSGQGVPYGQEPGERGTPYGGQGGQARPGEWEAPSYGQQAAHGQESQEGPYGQGQQGYPGTGQGYPAGQEYPGAGQGQPYQAPLTPGGPGYPGAPPYQGGYQSPYQKSGGGLGTTALVLGIASIFLLLACGLGVLTAIAGLIIGLVALAKNSNRGRAIWGIALSALALVLAVVFLTWFYSRVGDCMNLPQNLQQRCVEERLGVQVQSAPQWLP